MTKKTKLSLYDANQLVDKLLASGKCISEIDVKVLDELMYWHPNVYIKFIDKVNHSVNKQK